MNETIVEPQLEHCVSFRITCYTRDVWVRRLVLDLEGRTDLKRLIGLRLFTLEQRKLWEVHIFCEARIQQGTGLLSFVRDMTKRD